MKVALAQLNSVVGDVPRNVGRIREAIASAASQGAELIVFSELSFTGYPPRDLLEDPSLIDANVAALDEIAGCCHGIAALVGFARPATESFGPELEDAAALLVEGEIRQVFVKSLLPNYSVYDDPRYFRPGRGPGRFEWDGQVVGVTICEDLWDSTALGRDLYGLDPIGMLADRGVDVVLNVSASGFQRGKIRQREDLIARQARRCGAPLLYVNQVGGNDEMVFDGCSCAFSASGDLLGRAAAFREDLLLVDTDAGAARCEPHGEEMERLAEGLKLGLRDYVLKSGFEGVVLPLNGDVGSAVVALLSAEALGPERVEAIIAADRNATDAPASAHQLAEGLGIRTRVVSTQEAEDAFMAFRPPTTDHEAGTVRDRYANAVRGTLVSATAEAAGRLALATSDKTDLALGRCTAADVMPGSLAPVGDVFKSELRSLAAHLGHRPPRAQPVDLKACTGHAPDVDDPDGVTVDGILARYIEQGQAGEKIVGDGFDRDLVKGTLRRLHRSEYRRKQAPMVLMVSPRAFAGGWRFPVARHYD